MRCLTITMFIGLGGCGVTAIGDCFDPGAWSSYPFDGTRRWVYVSTDETVDYALVATSEGAPEIRGDASVYTVPFHTKCLQEASDCTDGVWIQDISWSSDRLRGVAVHAIRSGDSRLDLDPPIAIAEGGGCNGASTSITEVDGEVWTATEARDRVSCPIAMGSWSWDGCVVIDIQTTAQDGFPLAGTWWSKMAQGVNGFQRAGETGVWQLSEASCDGDCYGNW